MSNAKWYTGDTRDVLRSIPDASVDLVMTSSPFLALRSYLPADHPDKALEIGSEPNPGAFLDVLLDVVVELRRVLAPHGSLCVELGDTYASTTGGGGGGGDLSAEARGDWTKYRRGGTAPAVTGSDGWPLAKSLCLVPSSFAWALAYGRNPWTGRELDPWRVRNLIAWCRPNPPVGALGDKFRPGTSYMTVACKSGSRYFDLNAVRTEGAPPLDWWNIPTHPYPGSHYATFPPELCVRPIKAMCPQRVCRVCGKPSERITSTEQVDTGRTTNGSKPRDRAESFAGTTYDKRTTVAVETLGWTDCDCPEHPPNMSGQSKWRNGIVLDPFAGSGTTLAVATGHGRDAIGINLDPRNYDLARERIGMFLEAA